MGQVCRKHEEFYEEACRWCEPEPAMVVTSPLAKASADSRIQTVRDMIAKGLLYGVSAVNTQNATAANAAPSFMVWVPHDYDGNYTCKRCGHVFIQNGQPSCPVLP